jgi:hypothetical protein
MENLIGCCRQNLSKQVTLAVLLLALLVASSGLLAATLSQPSYRITLDDGWVHSVEQGHRAGDGSRDMISIRHPDRSGVLKIQSFRVPNFIDRERLRAMTNVAWSEHLEWKAWGDFSGYQHSYTEDGVFYRQWWLTNDNTIVFFVHSDKVESDETDRGEIDRIVLSITSN